MTMHMKVLDILVITVGAPPHKEEIITLNIGAVYLPRFHHNILTL
jgi:hypothetical protein